MIPSSYNFFVSPTCAEIQAVQVAQAAQAEEIPKAKVSDWAQLSQLGGRAHFYTYTVITYFLVY